MNTIKRIFNERFENWDITFPDEALKAGIVGEIKEQGFLIQYKFGENEKGRFMDLYTSHRMTNDRHKRIYESGEIENLPALWDMHVNTEQGKEEYYQHNQDVSKQLRDKGFR